MGLRAGRPWGWPSKTPPQGARASDRPSFTAYSPPSQHPGAAVQAPSSCSTAPAAADTAPSSSAAPSSCGTVQLPPAAVQHPAVAVTTLTALRLEGLDTIFRISRLRGVLFLSASSPCWRPSPCLPPPKILRHCTDCPFSKTKTASASGLCIWYPVPTVAPLHSQLTQQPRNHIHGLLRWCGSGDTALRAHPNAAAVVWLRQRCTTSARLCT